MRYQAGHAIAFFLLALSVFGLLVPLPDSYRSVWLTKLFDLGHVPLFALVTVCFWWISGRSIRRAFGFSVALAVMGEIAQEFTGRSADLLDVLRGMLGALMAVLVVPVLAPPWRWRRLAGRLALVAALAAWPIWDCGPVLLDACEAARSFPVLSDWKSRWEATRWHTSAAHLEREEAGSGQSWAGRLTVSPHPGGSGAILFPVVRDWSGYRRLCCTFSFTGEPLSILISVRDGRKVEPPRKRFDLERRYPAGLHRVVIDLQELAAGTPFAPLDLSRIQSFHFLVTELTEPRTVLLHEIVLE
jgi:VanZ family protein